MTLVVDSTAKPTTTQAATTRHDADDDRGDHDRSDDHAASTTTPTTTAAAPAQPANATVPDVTGQKEAAAVTAFGNAGILASIVFVPGTDPLGNVLQQAKPSGTTVPFHSHVQINISRGPDGNTDETVPNVIGQTLTQAVSSLNAVHLRLIYLKYPVTSQAQAGKVVQQSPLSGAKVPRTARWSSTSAPSRRGKARTTLGRRGLYQPRRSSSSLGSSDCVEMPTIASPRPAETRASTSASM